MSYLKDEKLNSVLEGYFEENTERERVLTF